MTPETRARAALRRLLRPYAPSEQVRSLASAKRVRGELLPRRDGWHGSDAYRALSAYIDAHNWAGVGETLADRLESLAAADSSGVGTTTSKDFGLDAGT